MDWPLDIEDNESTSGLCEDEPTHSLSKMTAEHDTASISKTMSSSEHVLRKQNFVGDIVPDLKAPLSTGIARATDDPGHEHDKRDDTNSVDIDKH